MHKSKSEIRDMMIMKAKLNCEMYNMRSSEGFTLLEIMIVVSIIGLLATIAIPSFMSSRESTQKQICHENQSLIADMLDVYCLDKGRAPLVGNFGSIDIVKAALVPINTDERYIANREVFECPASSDGSQDDYNLVTSGGMIIGFECNKVGEHNE